MKEILMYYTSDFWIWAGITVGIVIAGSVVVDILRTFFDFIVKLIRGNVYPYQHVCHCNDETKTPEKKEEPKSDFVAFAGATATADLEVKGAKKNGSKKTK